MVFWKKTLNICVRTILDFFFIGPSFGGDNFDWENIGNEKRA